VGVYGIPWGSMRFYDVSVNQSVPTEANRSLTSYITAPVLMVKKPRGGIQFCIGYQGLNNITRKVCYLLHLFTETLRNVAKAKWCNNASKTRDPNLAWSHSEVYGSAWENRNLGSIDTYRSCTKGLQKTAYLHLGELPR
jgi:hypothetical protein